MTPSSDIADRVLAEYASWPDAPLTHVYGLVVAEGRLQCACPDGVKCPTPGKHPLGKDWGKRPHAPQALANALRRRPGNVGLLTGGPLGLVAIDVDGEAGRAVLKRLEAERGPLPATLTSTTGRRDGGEHRIFRCSDPTILASIKNSVGAFGNGLDVRATGGQIVVAPSMHSTGRLYAWRQPPRLDAIAELPDSWKELLSAPQGKGPSNVVATRQLRRAPGGRDGRLAELADEVASAPEGTRNQTLFRSALKAGVVLGQGGLDPENTRAKLIEAAQTAGLPAKEAIATTDSGLGIGLDKAGELPPRRASLADRMAAQALPPFPVDDLSPMLRAFAKAVGASREVSEDLPAVLVLAAVACACMGKVSVRVDVDWVEPVNIYAVVAMGSGEGKSPVMNLITKPFHEAEDATLGLRLLMKDATPEALAVEMAKHGERMGLFDDESNVLSHMMGRYQRRGSPANIDIYLNAYDGGRFTVARIRRDQVLLRRPLLTMGIAVQPVVIEQLSGDPTPGDRGLLNRMLFSLPPSLLGYRRHARHPIPPGVQAGYDDAIIRWCNWKAAEDAEIVLSPAAAAEHQAFLEHEEPSYRPGAANYAIKEWCVKLLGAVPRLAALLHLADHAEAPDLALRTPVAAATMARAIRIGLYFREHARAVLTGNAPEDLGVAATVRGAREVLAWARNCERTSFNAADAKRGVYLLNKGRLPAEPPLRALVAAGFLVERGGAYSLPGSAQTGIGKEACGSDRAIAAENHHAVPEADAQNDDPRTGRPLASDVPGSGKASLEPTAEIPCKDDASGVAPLAMLACCPPPARSDDAS